MALLVAGAVALAVAGCGSSDRSTPRALGLERADLIAVYHALVGVEPSVRREVAATKLAWPRVIDGLPSPVGAATSGAIRTAYNGANALALPSLFRERMADSLTGPASGLADEFRSFDILATRGWRLIDAAAEQIDHGSPTAARFARANVALYIESVYDAHFTLAQIGKQMRKGWEKLEGAPAFGASLTLAEVEALADVYSEPNFELLPHARVKLGS
jgi:hypothetical protein